MLRNLKFLLSTILIVQTDPSDTGIETVFLQEKGEHKLPVAYASFKLKSSE